MLFVPREWHIFDPSVERSLAGRPPPVWARVATVVLPLLAVLVSLAGLLVA